MLCIPVLEGSSCGAKVPLLFLLSSDICSVDYRFPQAVAIHRAGVDSFPAVTPSRHIGGLVEDLLVVSGNDTGNIREAAVGNLQIASVKQFV